MLCVMLLVVATACGSGDDDDDTGAATSTATTESASSASDSSPTTADDTNATATEEDTAASATATEEEEDAATATKAADNEPAASATTGGSTTATEPAGVTTPATDDGTADIPEFETLDPELLPNFSLTMNFDAVNLSGTPRTTLKMQMQQSSLDNYHLNMDTDGEVLEFWTIGEQSWTSLAGEIVESPTGPLFSPADILTTGELIPEGLEAREDGAEKVNGRQTTKWVIDGADYVQYMNDETVVDGTTTVEMTDGAGEVTIWIDDELNIMIKADGDVAWKNSDGTDGSLVYDYEIHDVGSTAEVQAPQ